MTVIILGFDQIKQEYPTHKDFGTAYIDLHNGNQGKHPQFNIHDGFLFNGTKLCLSTTSSTQKHVVRELHSERCSGHLGRDKRLMVSASVNDVVLVNWPKGTKRIKDYTSHDRFHMHHGKLSAWTLC